MCECALYHSKKVHKKDQKLCFSSFPMVSLLQSVIDDRSEMVNHPTNKLTGADLFSESFPVQRISLSF